MAHILAVAAALALLAPPSAAAQAAAGSRILVVPFENIQHEPRLHWLSEASAVLLGDQPCPRALLQWRNCSAKRRSHR